MKRPAVASSLVAAAALLALVLLPGAAQARTGDDSRCAGQPLDPTIVCGKLTPVTPEGDDNDGDTTLGGPTDSAPAPGDPRQCASDRYIGWTRNYDHAVDSYLWQWDFYVEGGAWVVWNGHMPGQWPADFSLPGGQTGLVSIAATVTNWTSASAYDARIFWLCFPLSNPNTNMAPGPGAAAAAGGPSRGLDRIGDKGDDRLRGTGKDNAVIGRSGNDRLSGRGGDDHLHAGPGEDALFAGDGDDLMHAGRGGDTSFGGDGNDDILSGKGADISHGGQGGDQLFDDEGTDTLRGGPGNDRFSARDGDRDVIDCGSGLDIAIIDRFDVAIGCEFAFRTAAETPKVLPRN
jgi:Ca2+-binding RTX toxin-like protein